MTLSRSLTIAAGAGIAGLCLGLIMAGQNVSSVAEASGNDEAYLVVITETDAPDALGQLTEILESEGALSVALSDHTDHGHTVLVTRWPDSETAQRAMESPDYRRFTAETADGSEELESVLAPLVERATAP